MRFLWAKVLCPESGRVSSNPLELEKVEIGRPCRLYGKYGEHCRSRTRRSSWSSDTGIVLVQGLGLFDLEPVLEE